MSEDHCDRSLIVHRQLRGKLGVISKLPINDRDELSLAYTPGVARPCEEIAKDKSLARILTIKGNSVAVVADVLLLWDWVILIPRQQFQ